MSFRSERHFANGNNTTQRPRLPPTSAPRQAQAVKKFVSRRDNGSLKMRKRKGIDEFELPIEWYHEPRPENEGFIIDTALDIATEYGCDLIRIRKEIHNTKSAWRDAEIEAPTEPKAMRMGRHAVVKPKPRPARIQDIVPAPWHYTVEFHRIDSDMYFTAHVYADTETVEIDGEEVKGISNGMLSIPDGDEIPENPEVFDESERPCTRGKRDYRTWHWIPLLPEHLVKVPRTRDPLDTKLTQQKPVDKRLERVHSQREPRRQVKDQLPTLNYH